MSSMLMVRAAFNNLLYLSMKETWLAGIHCVLQVNNEIVFYDYFQQFIESTVCCHEDKGTISGVFECKAICLIDSVVGYWYLGETLT